MAVVGDLDKFQMPNGDEYTLTDQTVRDDIADEFDPTSDYGIGKIVMYEGQTYKYKVAHTAGTWNSAEVDPVVLANAMKCTEFTVSGKKLIITQS